MLDIQTIDPTQRFVRLSSTFEMEVEGHTVVIDRTSEQMLTLNEAGGLLWQRLAEEATVEDLVSACLRRWPEAAQETVEEDVTSFLQHAVGTGVVVVDG